MYDSDEPTPSCRTLFPPTIWKAKTTVPMLILIFTNCAMTIIAKATSVVSFTTPMAAPVSLLKTVHLPKPKRTLMVCMPMLLKHWITTRMSTQIVLAIQCFGRNTCLLDNRFGIRFTTQPAEVWVYLRNSIGVVEPVNLVVNLPLIKVEPHIILNIVCFLS